MEKIMVNNKFTEEEIDEILYKKHKFTEQSLNLILNKYNISKEELVSIIKGYELTQSELDNTVEKIYNTLIKGVYPKKQPIAVIVGGQSGGGKTAIIGYVSKCFKDNCVIIDNDFYREFHPNIDDINKKYQDLMTECTDQLSFYATPIIIDKLMNDGFNLIIHQTLKGTRIADDAMKKLKDKGYIVGVMALAVSELESNMSMTERCLEQLKVDYTCRWVAQDNHDIAFNGLPSTVEYIENCPNWHFINIVERGIDDPTNPRVIYVSFNKSNTPNDMQNIAQYFDIRKIDSKYKTAKEAVLGGRKRSAAEFHANFEKRYNDAFSDIRNIYGNVDCVAYDRLNYVKQLAEKDISFNKNNKLNKD